MALEHQRFSHIGTNPIGSRLKQEMKKRGLTSTELARRSDVLTSFLYDIISGKSSNPSTVKLARVADALGVSLTFLVSGRIDESSDLQISDNYVTVPRIMASPSPVGGNIITHEESGEPYRFSKNWINEHLGANADDLRLMVISGDSMEPSLCHNDMVLVDVSKKHPSPPAIFILFDGFGLVAKRCEYLDGVARIRTVSDNPHYSAYENSSSELVIIGRVVWFARDI